MRITLLLMLSAIIACGPTASHPGSVETATVSESLQSQPQLVAAFASLTQVGPQRWRVVIDGRVVILQEQGAYLQVIDSARGITLFEVDSAAIREDLATFGAEQPEPETSALKLKWLGKLLKAIADLFNRGGDATGANACGTQARLACGEGCVASVSSTFLSCKFTCKSGGNCGGVGAIEPLDP